MLLVRDLVDNTYHRIDSTKQELKDKLSELYGGVVVGDEELNESYEVIEIDKLELSVIEDIC